MKYLKKFEVVFEKDLKIGDYAIMATPSSYCKKYMEFMSNNAGKIMILKDGYVLLKYENIPDEFIYAFRPMRINDIEPIFNGKWFDIENIVEYSKSKEELESKMVAKKYDL